MKKKKKKIDSIQKCCALRRAPLWRVSFGETRPSAGRRKTVHSQKMANLVRHMLMHGWKRKHNEGRVLLCIAISPINNAQKGRTAKHQQDQVTRTSRLRVAKQAKIRGENEHETTNNNERKRIHGEGPHLNGAPRYDVLLSAEQSANTNASKRGHGKKTIKTAPPSAAIKNGRQQQPQPNH